MVVYPNKIVGYPDIGVHRDFWVYPDFGVHHDVGAYPDIGVYPDQGEQQYLIKQ
jgi:hypothetical protein